MNPPAIRPTPLEYRYRGHSPWRTLWSLYRGHRLRLVGAVMLYVVKHSPTWVLPIVMASVINVLTGRPSDAAARIIRNAVVMSVLILQNIPVHVWYTRQLSLVLRSVEAALRMSLVVRLQQLSMAFHDRMHSGRIQAKVLRDAEAVEILSKQLINTVLNGVLTIGFAVVVSLRREPWMTLLFLVGVPLAQGIRHLYKRRMRELNQTYRRQVEQMASAVTEMVEMIPVTRAHGVEHTEVDRMSQELDEVRRRGLSLDVLQAWFMSSHWVTFQIAQLLCLAVTGWFVWTGRMPVGDLVMYQTYFGMVLGAVGGLLAVYPQLAQGFESLRSMGEVLECPDLEVNEHKRPVPEVRGRFSFEDVGFAYEEGRAPALEGLDLDVAAGECLAVVGESGSGKSTLMNLVIGFRRPTRGRILLDGEDMAGLDLRQYRRRLAVVPQQTLLFSGTVRENITYGLPGVGEERVQAAIDLANLRSVVAGLPDGLDTALGEHGGRLSGGQRQRISIARAFIRDPRVVILDEATSALDVVSEAEVQEAIHRLLEGRTTFIVAHRLSTIRHAHRIAVFKAGRLVELGPAEDLLALDGEFARLKRLQH